MKNILKFTVIIIGLCFGCNKPIEKVESTTVKTKTISPYLFGQNLWLTNRAEGRPGYIQKSLWGKVKKSGPTIIRIGGNGYDIKMPPIETLETWVKSIKKIGAEPIFQVSKLDSPERAAEFVKHFSKDSLKVKYWSIGNEPYGMAKWSIDSISKMIKTYATAMKVVNPKIKIFVPDAATYYNDLYEALLLSDEKGVAGRDENGNWYIDGVNFHSYPNGKEYTRKDVVFNSVDKIRGQILSLKEDLDASNLKYNRTGDAALTWGLTEFNITYSNPDDLGLEGISVPSFINGQFWVDIFALSMEYEAFCVTPWCIQESDVAKTYFGYIGSPPNFTPHSTYYHMQMMSKNIKGNYIKMSCNKGFFKILGSENETENSFLLMNQNEKESYSFDLNSINKKNNNDLLITSEKELKANFKGIITPNSSMVLVFNKSGVLKKQVIYTIEMAKDNKAPEVIIY
jgi:hypothetical protein